MAIVFERKSMYSLRSLTFEHILYLNCERDIPIQSKDLRVCEVWHPLFRKGHHAWLSSIGRVNERSGQEDNLRTFPLVLSFERHVEQLTSSPPTKFAYTPACTHESNHSSVKTGVQDQKKAILRGCSIAHDLPTALARHRSYL
jgi:hypothetical protein